LARIFDRYYTHRPAEVACSGQVSPTHFGIGLWLARQNTLSLGGSINAFNRDPSGLCVAVVLPTAKGG
jgi:signal transduction histidine kinase